MSAQRHANFAKLTFILLVAFAVSNIDEAQTAISVDGSMGSMPLVHALAKALQAKQPDVTLEFGKGLKPKARIDALASGTIDIALASRGLNIDALARHGMHVTEIARMAVVFATHASAGVDKLSDNQVCGIFAGSIKNWKEVGGADLAIEAHARPESEVDTERFRNAVNCFKSLTFASNVKIVQRASDMTKELTDTKGAIGLTTTTVVEQSGGKIRALALSGAVANEPNVSPSKYLIAREVFLIVKGDVSPTVQQFLAFIRSPEGAAIINSNGAITTSARS